MLKPKSNSIPPLSPQNNNRIGVSQPRSNCVQSPMSTHNRNRNIMQSKIQSLLKQQVGGCFVTTKKITIYGKTVPAGTAGKIVMSRRKAGLYCCIFAIPHNDIEVQVNPALYLNFGMSLSVALFVM